MTAGLLTKKWHDGCHTHPCSETRYIDSVLNELEACTFLPTPADQALCWAQARKRHEAARHNRELKYAGDGLLIHFQGALCELGTARCLRLKFELTLNTYRLPDLPFDIEVKGHTQYGGHLLVPKDQPDHHKMVLAITDRTGSRVYVAGWIYAAEAKSFLLIDPGGYDRQRGHAPRVHGVPQSDLRPIKELRELCR